MKQPSGARYHALPPDAREAIDRNNRAITTSLISQGDIPPEFRLNTAQFAEAHAVKPQTIRKRLCQTGSYFGVRPYTLASGRLLWPAVRIVR